MKSCRSYRSCRSCRAYASDRSCTVHPIDLEDAVDPAELEFQIKFLVKLFHLSSYFVRISKKYFRQNICTVSEVRWGKGSREDEFAVQENTHTTKSPREIATVKTNKWTPM